MRHFVYKNLEQLEEAAREIGAESVRFEHDTAKVQAALGGKVKVGDREIGNSMAIHPMEGCDGELDGRPGELTLRRYERFGRGGAKLIWFEATAVRDDGRANTRQLAINRETLPALASMLEMTRRVHREEWGNTDDLLEPLQLTHSGRFSVPRRTIAFHQPEVDAYYNIPADYPVITDDELERLEDQYVEAAKLAASVGFRAVDLKATHGYLLSELLDARQRDGRYGGSIENRTRFVCNVAGKIRAALGDQLLLAMRLGCFTSLPHDRKTGAPVEHALPYRFGFGTSESNPSEPDVEEVKQAIARFQQAGVQLINVSLGVPYYNPHIGRPFERPDEGNYESPEHPLIGVNRHFRIAGELQRAFPEIAMVGTGYSWLQIYAINAGAANVADGSIRFFGMGRNVLSYPDFARDVLEKGKLEELRVCKTLTYCTFLMRQKGNELGQFPAGCPPFDKLVYGPIMKEARDSYRKQQSSVKAGSK